jgi:hypothetical protein
MSPKKKPPTPKKKVKQFPKPSVRRFPPAKAGDFMHPDSASIPTKARGLLDTTGIMGLARFELAT